MSAPAESLPVARASPALAVASTATSDAFMTKTQILANRHLVREVMEGVMVAGIHYGVIPGTGKPTLYKPGSEVLMSVFRIAVKPAVEDLSSADVIRYRVTLRGVHSPTGIEIGEGVGECSSNEEKYKWRAAVCEAEFDETPEDRRRKKWKKGSNGPWQVIQVRTEPDDLANTVLKMAKKRAQIDFTLTGLAVSDLFNQDLEDLSRELRDSVIDLDTGESTEPKREAQPRGKPATQAPQAKSGGTGRCTEKQAAMLKKRLDNSGIPENEFFTKFGVAAITELPFGKVDEALGWISTTGG